MHQPAFALQHVIELGALGVVRPHAEKGRHTHGVKLLVHGGGVGPPGRVKIHLTLARHVQEVHDQHIKRQLAVAISLGNIERLLLGGIDGLALNVAIGGFGQQVRYAGKLAIARVDFVALVAGNHKEGDAVADLGGPDIQLVEAEIDGCFGGVVPDEAVAAAGNHERNADILSANREVIVPALNAMTAQVEKPLLLLAEAVIMLALRRVKGSGNAVARAFLAVRIRGRCRGVVGDHGPFIQLQQLLAGESGYGNDVVVWPVPIAAAAKVVIPERLIQRIQMEGVGWRKIFRSNTDDQSARADDVIAVRLPLLGPSGH